MHEILTIGLHFVQFTLKLDNPYILITNNQYRPTGIL